MGRRVSLEIMSEILILCQQPRARTRVMYLTNLSHKLLVKYLAALQDLRFLEANGSTQKYATTVRGMVFVEKWVELQEMVNNEYATRFPIETSVHPTRDFSPLLYPQLSS